MTILRDRNAIYFTFRQRQAISCREHTNSNSLLCFSGTAGYLESCFS